MSMSACAWSFRSVCLRVRSACIGCQRMLTCHRWQLTSGGRQQLCYASILQCEHCYTLLMLRSSHDHVQPSCPSSTLKIERLQRWDQRELHLRGQELAPQPWLCGPKLMHPEALQIPNSSDN